MTKEREAMNYKDLLVKYIKYLQYTEGIDGIKFSNWEKEFKKEFTKEEQKELKTLSK